MADRMLATAPRTFVLAGHSMGGRVALEVARRVPERVLGLGLLNTGVHPCRDEEIESRGRLVRLAQEKGMSALAAEWLPPMMGTAPNRHSQIIAQPVQMVERATPASFAAQTQALLNRPDGRTVLPTIRCPTLLVSGTGDRWSPLAQHEDMLRELCDAELVAIEDAGHMAPIEQPAAVAAAMQRWLKRL